MGLNRFLIAQEKTYLTALDEITNGKKLTHWMWFIFPQIQGLGNSETAKLYAIKDINEAKEYLKHPILEERLVEITNEVLNYKELSVIEIFGTPDNLKFHSSMTLFDMMCDNRNNIFNAALKAFFNSEQDELTLKLL